MIETEFKKKYLGLDLSLSNKNTLPMAVIPQSISIPNEFDWRDHNAVTPVKNQVFKNCFYIILNYNKCSIVMYSTFISSTFKL